MKNSNDEAFRNDLVKIAIIGVLGIVFFIILEFLLMAGRESWASFNLRDRWISAALATAIIILQTSFLWFGANVLLGLGIAFTMSTELLMEIIAVSRRLPLRLDKWLLRPSIAILAWIVVLRQPPRQEE